MDEVDERIAQELLAALEDMRRATEAVDAARRRGGPPLERARQREQEAIERVRDLARQLGLP